MKTPPRRIIRAAHSGDLGDIIASLPILRRYGGGEYILAPHIGTHGPREPMTPQRAAWLLPLLQAQPYITTAYYKTHLLRQEIALYFLNFRRARMDGTLVGWHCNHARISKRHIDMVPWIIAPPAEVTKGRVLINRTSRYQNPEFPWKQLVAKYADRICFAGSDREYEDFQWQFGNLDRVLAANALELASLVAGSDLFIGNQSFCCWLAMSQGHPLVQETYPGGPDSMIQRPNAQFIFNRAKNRRFFEELETSDPRTSGAADNGSHSDAVPPASCQEPSAIPSQHPSVSLL